MRAAILCLLLVSCAVPGDDNSAAALAGDAGAPADACGPQADVFLLVGQSNAVGFGYGPTMIATSPSLGFDTDPDAHTLYPLRYPTGLPAGGYWTGQTSGIAPAFADAWARLSSHTPVIVARGKAASGLVEAADLGQGDWTDTIDNDGLFDAAAMALAATVQTTEAAGYTVVARYVIWWQGESDGERQISDAAYRAAFHDLEARFASIGVDHVFIVQIGYRKPTAAFDSRSAYETIQRALALASIDTPRAVLVSTLPSALSRACLFAGEPGCGLRDDWHYTTLGYEAIGSDAARNAYAFVATGRRPL